MRYTLLFLLCTSAYSVEIPNEILHAILEVETQSYVDASGRVVYVDKKVGDAGEYGPYQMTQVAFDQIYKGERPRSDLKHDMKFATQLTCRYLSWLHENFSHGDWMRTIQYYNAGPRHRSKEYLKRITDSMQQP